MQTILKFLLIVTFFSCQSEYKRYVPIYPIDNSISTRFEEYPDSLTPKHIEGIKRVFSYYGVSFRVENGSVYYKGTINKELLWNYSLKASDDQWLNTHN
jgi:hypothetical protein